ncbi:MAG: hypothetical protein ACRDD1_13425, partial [Planctomycetia bacterium]
MTERTRPPVPAAAARLMESSADDAVPERSFLDPALDAFHIHGARTHNLRALDLSVPRERLVV